MSKDTKQLEREVYLEANVLYTEGSIRCSDGPMEEEEAVRANAQAQVELLQERNRRLHNNLKVLWNRMRRLGKMERQTPDIYPSMQRAIYNMTKRTENRIRKTEIAIYKTEVSLNYFWVLAEEE